MTDKQIIIDGVDVSECETIDTHSDWCSFWEENCAKNPECIYKKYLRKKQECERLKNEIECCYNQVEDFDIIATSKSNKLEQAEQKLEQIRVIAFHNCDITDKNDPCYKTLQIINEVEL